MTNEQAISILKMVEAHGSLTIKAKEMAIRSLEAWQKMPEIFEKRLKPVSDGEDRSKERHRYMQWLADYNAIKGLIEGVEQDG